MKLILLLVTILASLSVVFSAVALAPKIPGKPGHCWSEETGPMEKGAKQNLKNQCASASCGGDGTIQFISCGAVAGVSKKPDLSKPYPQCCPYSN